MIGVFAITYLLMAGLAYAIWQGVCKPMDDELVEIVRRYLKS